MKRSSKSSETTNELPSRLFFGQGYEEIRSIREHSQGRTGRTKTAGSVAALDFFHIVLDRCSIAMCQGAVLGRRPHHHPGIPEHTLRCWWLEEG